MNISFELIERIRLFNKFFPVLMFSIPASACFSAESDKNIFDYELLAGTSFSKAMLEQFNKKNYVKPGVYQVDIFVNRAFKHHISVEFVEDKNGMVNPCLEDKILLDSGVNKIYLISADTKENKSASAADKSTSCMNIKDRIKGASSQFNQSQLRLEISVPQAFMLNSESGEIDFDTLDKGESMLFVNYDGNYYHSSAGDSKSSSYYLGLNSGVNLGLWRLRHQSSYSYSDMSTNENGRWQSIRTYLQRALPAIKSEITIGDNFTNSNMMSGIAFRGIQLYSDDRMLPASKLGYSPAVKGIALTNAKITVKQAGKAIYQTTVSPGPFLISDLYATSYQGDLNVEVAESDGRVFYFTVPFSAVPDSMRVNTSKYSMSLGEVKVFKGNDELFLDLNYQYGLSNFLTLNTGFRAARGYQSLLSGAVWGTSAGALGLNMIYSNADMPNGEKEQGWRTSATYSKTFSDTATTLALAGYRYSTMGYRDLTDVLGLRAANRQGEESSWQSNTYNQREQLSLNISQSLGERWGQLNFTGSRSNYYGNREADTQIQFFYSNIYKKVAYNLSFTRQKTGNFNGQDYGGSNNNLFLFSISVPLGGPAGASSLSSSLSYNNSESQLNTSLSGVADDEKTISYDLTASYENKDHAGSFSSSIQKRLGIASVGASYSKGPNYWQAGANISGSAVLHSGGATLGPYLTDTFAVVEAKGASGAEVLNANGVTIDSFGYALIPSLLPYHNNNVGIGSAGLNDNAEIQGSQKTVAPYAGSFVKLKFDTLIGSAILFSAKLPNGNYLPVGSFVTDEKGAEIGSVGQGGQVYARVPGVAGMVNIKWGDEADQQCLLHYDLTGRTKTRSLFREKAVCTWL